MPVAPLNIIKRYDEFLPRDHIRLIPRNTRGIYALLKKWRDTYKVIYIGMAGGDKAGIHSRLNSHVRSNKKGDAWTHFSIFEVHDNISKEVIRELEGLFRHIYWKDSQTLGSNDQRKFKKINEVHEKLANWKVHTS